MFRAVHADSGNDEVMWVTQDVSNPDAGPIEGLWETFQIASQDFPKIEPVIKDANREVKQSLAKLYNAVVGQVAMGATGAPHKDVKAAVHESWTVITQAMGMTDDNYDYDLSQAKQFRIILGALKKPCLSILRKEIKIQL